jgi:predicted O-linked N-acetylglucosamine transferase (SPINDLY family)
VVGCLRADHEPARHLTLLVETLLDQGVESQVFTTEWDSSWFFNTNGSPADSSDTPHGAVVASTDGDFVERAERIAAAIRASGVDAVFYHADFNEQITARVAAFRPAMLQLNVAHGTAIDADLFDGFIHLKKQSMGASHHSTEPRVWIPAPSDIAERVLMCPPDMRQAMGLGAAETVSATVGDLQLVSEPKYLYVVTGLLKVFPNHFHLFAGNGDVKAIRAALHAEGVLTRVRFLGSISDTASVMAVTDLYLCPFKRFDESPLMEAMAAGRPCIAARDSAEHAQNSAVEILGVPELIADSDVAYLQIAQGLLRDAEARQRASDLVASRFQSEFASALLGRKYLDFVSSISSH